MSKVFKKNSRFDCLIDQTDTNFVRRPIPDNRDNRYIRDDRPQVVSKKKTFEFNDNQFPLLSNNVDVQNITSDISYVDKINTVQKETSVIVPQLDYGWCSIELDRSKNTPIFTNYVPTSNARVYDGELVIHNLNSKYATFVDNYIELWGEAEYIKMFMFPNHDYDYFENLDCEAEEFMEDNYNQDNYNQDNYNQDNYNDTFNDVYYR
jgi:hypothetical protein